ncbi:hypothetical protein [Hydrogenophaga sp.]|nr:hypothetical protein [Hydrogenophaga sp.]MDP2419467.1 hypothetical protein [Hydrogenophaga sp.]
MPYHRGMHHYLTGLGDVLKLRVAASSNAAVQGTLRDKAALRL